VWNQQPMQGPSLATPSRRNQDDRARRCTENVCRHAAKRAQPKIRPNLRAHHDQGGTAFFGCFDDGRGSRAWPVLDYESRDIITRELHTFDECGGCQGVITDVKERNSRTQQLGEGPRYRHGRRRMD
jgi:hypothetical protein